MSLQPTAITEPEVVEDKPLEVIKTTLPAHCNDYYEEVSKYDWDVDIAMKIMKAESNCQPNALNPRDNHKVCSGSIGLMQVGCLHVEEPEKLYDPKYNIEVAYRVYTESGWNAWTTYKKI